MVPRLLIIGPLKNVALTFLGGGGWGHLSDFLGEGSICRGGLRGVLVDVSIGIIVGFPVGVLVRTIVVFLPRPSNMGTEKVFP